MLDRTLSVCFPLSTILLALLQWELTCLVIGLDCALNSLVCTTGQDAALQIDVVFD
jgi:hypothetical protein